MVNFCGLGGHFVGQMVNLDVHFVGQMVNFWVQGFVDFPGKGSRARRVE